MRISLVGVLSLFAIVSLALTFSQYSPVISGIALSFIVALAWLGLPTRMWRRLAYGSVLGIVFAVILLACIVFTRTGRWFASNYQESHEMRAISEPWTPNVIPVGALVGSTIAITYSRRQLFNQP